MTDGAEQIAPRSPRGRKPYSEKKPLVKKRFYCASSDGCLAWLAKDGTYRLVEFNFYGQAQNICRRMQNVLGIPHGVVTQEYQLSEEEAEREREHLRSCHRQSYRNCKHKQKGTGA